MTTAELPRQVEFCLPPQAANDGIREKLSVLVEQFNASHDPAERVELHVGIVRLRSLLERRGAS